MAHFFNYLKFREKIFHTKIYLSKLKGVQYNYQIEIIEPKTPWRNNITLLSQKNRHNVEASIIKRTLTDFENVCLPSLIEQCRQDISKDQSNKKRLSPTGILDHINIDTNNWSSNGNDLGLSSFLSNSSLEKKPSPTKDNDIKFYLNDTLAISKSTDITTTDSEYFDCKSKDTESQFGSNKSEEDEFKSFSLNETESNEEINGQIMESLEILKSMFPTIDRDIIVDFLQKYENDLNTVTNILLDSVNFSDIEPIQESNQHNEQIKMYQVKSLQEICLIEMEKLELAMEKLNSRIQLVKSNAKISSLTGQSLSRKSEEPTQNQSMSNDMVQSEDKIKNDEPIIYLKVDKIKALVDLFGTDEEFETFDGRKI